MRATHVQLRRLFHFGCLLPLLLLAKPSSAALQVSLTRSESGASLSWNELPGPYHYTVQWRASLGEGAWEVYPDETAWPITAPSWLDPRPPAGAARFYRVLAVPAVERGKILSSAAVRTWSTFELNFLALQLGVSISAQYPVRVYKVVYETIDPHGFSTQASGAVALPVNPGKAVPMFSYQHGTILSKTDVPSNQSTEVMAGVLFAATGYATAMPDFLGLGESPGFHPYHHAKSQATASVDLLRAAATLSASNSVELNGQLFLSGYSQGGHATMSLHREIESLHTNEFTITASAPMAGAYDLSGVTMEDFLSERGMPNPYYFVYLLEAYRQVYRLADSLSELLAPPYDSTLPPLLDGFHSSSEVNNAMPSRAVNILKPEYLQEFLNDHDHPLRAALRENDVYDWTPAAPMRLYHCSGDEDVLYANSIKARDTFHSRGATEVLLIDSLPGGDHGDCVLPSLILAKEWFDSWKQ
jgi:alpha/beta superfamily hydrolase